MHDVYEYVDVYVYVYAHGLVYTHIKFATSSHLSGLGCVFRVQGSRPEIKSVKIYI